MNFDWLEHLFTSLIGGGMVGGIVAILKIRSDNRAQNATAEKTENEAGSEIIEQAKAVVQMWQEIGQQLQDKVKDLETRLACLEVSDKAKTIWIVELETSNATKDLRVRELESRLINLEASEKAKTLRINELEITNAAKDLRIRELEHDVERLQKEMFALKQAQGL